MPRYFFHCTDGRDGTLDLEGVELADEASTRSRAFEVARSVLGAARSAVSDWSGWAVEVSDEAGRILLVLPLSEL